MNHTTEFPNILFVFSDQHRWSDLGCYGNQEVATPNFDAFAKRSIRFTNCISNCPVCVPARGILLSGLFPLRHGAAANDLPLKDETETIGHVLKANGYHTGYIGKWHLAGVPRDQSIPAGKRRFGFDEWKVANCNHDYLHSYYDDEHDNRFKIDGYEPVEQTNLAVDFITRNKNQTPWCLVLSWGPPHDPYQAVPQKFADMYKEADISLRENVPGNIQATLTKTLTREQIRSNYRGYYAHISALDEQFGRLLAALKQSGQMDNTIVIYTSDHGDMLGSQGVTNKQWHYEESIKVPLILYWQGRTRRGTSEELIGLVDLPVSLLGLIGLQFGKPVDGKDLHPLFTNKDAKGPEACYIFDLIPSHQAADRGSSEWRGLRTRRYTFARSASDEGFAMYDNRNDPFQMHNLVNDADKQGLRLSLLELLDQYIGKHDRLLPWEELIRKYGLQEEWNRSQSYFRRPVLE